MRRALFASVSGATVVMLLPARTDTRWFHEYIYGKAEIRFIRGRLKFGGADNAAPFPSMVVIYRNKDDCCELRGAKALTEMKILSSYAGRLRSMEVVNDATPR